MPVPSLEETDRLSALVRTDAPDLLIAVGGGTLSDMVKKISLDTGIPNWCVATAPSVDAYTSAKSAIRIEGYHNGIHAAVSEVVLCDTDILAKAPVELFLSGVGDLLGKLLAFIDWRLAHWLTGETFDLEASRIALESARYAIRACIEMTDSDTPVKAVEAVTDAILTSGLVMQSVGGSRPAASAEHTIAHFWEMSHAVSVPKWDLHGILTAVGARLVYEAYKRLYVKFADASFDLTAIGRRLESLRDWRQKISPEMRAYEHKMSEEMRSRSFEPAVLLGHAEKAVGRRDEILSLAGPIIKELGEAIEALAEAGVPFGLGTVGLDRDAVSDSLDHVRLLRNRYGTFDMMWELGLDEEILADLKARIYAGEFD